MSEQEIPTKDYKYKIQLAKDLIEGRPIFGDTNRKNVEIQRQNIFPALAETMLVPKRFPFRQSRCEELRKWCKMSNWKVKLKARTLENP